MSELGDKLREEVQRIIDEPMPEPELSEVIRLETENIFDSAGYPLPPEEMEAFLDNPMAMVMKVLTNYLDLLKPRIPEPIKSEHEVRIYHLDKEYSLEPLERIAEEIEDLLNDGYCCHMPTVVGDYVIMDFSRRKESEKE